MSDSVENALPDKLIPALPTTEGKKCDKGICFVEIMFSHINDLLMKKKLIKEPVKFSIHHFIQHIFNFSDIPDHRLQCKAKFPLPFETQHIASYIASGSGSVLYEDDPVEITIEELIRHNNTYTTKQIKVPYFIGTIGNTECGFRVRLYVRIKEILSEYPSLIGSISILSDCLNMENKSYCHDVRFELDSAEMNYPKHLIRIIGYDDNYPKENFNFDKYAEKNDTAV